MHTETTLPYITLWKNDLSTDYPKVKQGSIHRDYLKNTYDSHAYHCQPMTTAHISGWEFLLPQDVTIIWDGVSDSSKDHIKILDGEFYQGKRIVRTDTGNGMLTFDLNVTIETDKKHYSILKGSPNYFIEDATPIEVVIRTDYFNFFENFFCWKINKSNKPITFKKNMPIAFLINYPIDLLESTNIEFKDFNLDKDKVFQKENYAQIKSDFFKNAKDWEWSHFYRKGKISSDTELGIKIKPKLMEP